MTVTDKQPSLLLGYIALHREISDWVSNVARDCDDESRRIADVLQEMFPQVDDDGAHYFGDGLRCGLYLASKGVLR